MTKMSEKDIKKKLDEVLGNTPEVKMYSIEELEKWGHTGPTCPTTGNPYKEIEIRGFREYRVICSECDRTLYSCRRKIKRLFN